MKYFLSSPIIYLIICMFITCSVTAQNDLREANNLFNKLAYADAIPKFEKALAKDASSFEAKLKLAESYRLTGNYVQAEKWYGAVVKETSAGDLERFHYGQMLMNNGKHDEAKKWLKISEQERPHDERVANHLNSIDYINRFYTDSVNYKLTNLSVNGSGSEFSPAFFKQGIVYTASNATKTKAKIHSWTGESFTQLFFSDSSNHTSEFAKEIRLKFNNGPAVFVGSEMFNTINIVKVSDSKKDLYKLNIVHSVFDGRKWSDPENFIHNSTNYNVAHPAISNDGTKLYFSSDMPGGEGGMDLYSCDKSGQTWAPPVNLGKTINTPGNEVFPSINNTGLIYFASNGHEGLGGLDIYAAPLNNLSDTPTAMSYPVNTRFDDFGFIINEEKLSGYFSSNRPGGKGGDDIYQFTFTQSILNGAVRNETTGKTLPNSTVKIVDTNTGKTQEVISDKEGKFRFQVSACHEYDVSANNSDYEIPITQLFKSSCVSAGANSIELLFKNPILKILPTDKYSSAAINLVNIELRDGETKELIKKFNTDNYSEQVEPCREYFIVATKDGLPAVKTYFKTSCVAKDETLNILMGLPPPDQTFIGGIVYDQDTKKELDSVAVIIYDINNKPVSTITSSREGFFSITGIKNVERIVFFRNGYFSVSKVIKEQADKKQIVIEMPSLQMDKIIKLEGIFYDLGKSAIRPDAARVLDNVVKVMLENPTLAIELGAHSDSRGKDISNLTLSDKRAKAAAAYITGKGIAESRILGKGYGESVLKNKCINGAKCSEKEHQENRRTEVRITSFY